jgi:hypothetical protein
VIYSYGFTQTIFQPSVREIVDAYLENGEFNFVLVNYRSILAYNVLVRFADVVLNLVNNLIDFRMQTSFQVASLAV